MMAYFYTSRNIHRVLQVPKLLQCDIMHECHSKPTAGHLGRTKTLSRISRQNLWWRGIACSVRSYIHACHTCRQTKPLNRKPAGFMISTNSSTPWEVVAVDLMGPLPKIYGGHEYLLVDY